MKTYKTVQALFRAESRWTTRCFARFRNGIQCDAGDKRAVCFCLAGGIYRVYPKGRRRENAFQRADRVAIKRGYTHVAHFNDDPKTTIADIRAVAKEAKI